MSTSIRSTENIAFCNVRIAEIIMQNTFDTFFAGRSLMDWSHGILMTGACAAAVCCAR